jgi:hypothetical protein
VESPPSPSPDRAGATFAGRDGDSDGRAHLDAAGVSAPEEEHLDQVLTGSPSAIAGEAETLQGQQRQAFIDGAQHGTVDGFDAAMLVIAVSALGGLVLWLVMMRPGGGRVSRPFPSSPPSGRA